MPYFTVWPPSLRDSERPQCGVHLHNRGRGRGRTQWQAASGSAADSIYPCALPVGPGAAAIMIMIVQFGAFYPARPPKRMARGPGPTRRKPKKVCYCEDEPDSEGLVRV